MLDSWHSYKHIAVILNWQAKQKKKTLIRVKRAILSLEKLEIHCLGGEVINCQLIWPLGGVVRKKAIFKRSPICSFHRTYRGHCKYVKNGALFGVTSKSDVCIISAMCAGESTLHQSLNTPVSITQHVMFASCTKDAFLQIRRGRWSKRIHDAKYRTILKENPLEAAYIDVQ